MRTQEPLPSRTLLVWWEGRTAMVSFPDVAAMESQAGQQTIKAWMNSTGMQSKPDFVVERVAPDDYYEVMPPWAGGTWGGYCGSTAWIFEPGRPVNQPTFVDHNVRCTQAWFTNGVGARRGWTGYRVECERRRHEGGEPCSGAGYRWSWAERATRQVEDILSDPDVLVRVQMGAQGESSR